MEKQESRPCDTATGRCRWININYELSISIQCCFKDCDYNFKTFTEFRRHFLETHFVDETSFSQPTLCGVKGCQMLLSDMDCYDRHLVFHCYHAELSYKGAEAFITDARTQGITCKNRADNANNVFYAGDYLRCFWEDCTTGFSDVEEFFKHVRCHINEFIDRDDIFCRWQDCTATFSLKSQMASHLKHHTGEKCVACPFCGAFFSNLTKFIDHIVRQSVSDSSRLKCFLCNKVFPSQRLLREHSRRHINTHKCPYCDMTSNGPHNLRLHIADRHSKLKAHKCSVCSSAFTRLSDLRRHFLKHSSTSEYKCEICASVFSSQNALTAHLRKHKAPQYVCHFCTKRYTRGSSLSSHFIKEHKLVLPSGHCRFMYKKCADDCYRLQTERYESAGLTNDQDDVTVQTCAARVASSSSKT